VCRIRSSGAPKNSDATSQLRRFATPNQYLPQDAEGKLPSVFQRIWNAPDMEFLMSEINPIAGSSGASLPTPIGRSQLDATSAASGANSTNASSRAHMHDRVEISEHARHLERLRQMPDIRQNKVEAARNAIAEGVYETPDRLRAALLKMLDEIEPG